MGPRKTPKYLCTCLEVTEAQVSEAIVEHRCSTLKQVTACTEAGAGCTVCHPAIKALLERRAKEAALKGEPSPPHACAPRAGASAYLAD
jgi:NAD(P)H-nitrite reductase large subunit